MSVKTESNFKIWSYSAKASSDKQGESILEYMEEFIDNVQKGSREENILLELILKSGLDLNVPVKEKEFGDFEEKSTVVFISFDDKIGAFALLKIPLKVEGDPSNHESWIHAGLFQNPRN